MTHLATLGFVVFFVVFSDLKLSLSADQRSVIYKNEPGLTSQLGIPPKKRPAGMNATGHFFSAELA